MVHAKPTNAVEAIAEGKAVEGVRAMRGRLARTIPGYEHAVEAEDHAERFCRELRQSLRDLRKKMGLDQKTLAERLDMTQSAVSKMENGEGDFGVKTLFRFAHALGLQPVFGFVPAASATASAAEKAVEDFQIDLVKDTFHKVSNAMAGFARTLK